MKKYVFILVSVLGLVFAASVSAADIKIGLFDIMKIMEQAPQVKAADLRLQKQFVSRAEALKTAARVLQKHAQELKRNIAVMSAEEKSTAQKQLLQENKDLQKQQTQFAQDLQNAQVKEMQKIKSYTKTVVANIAEREHYDLILEKSAVFYHKDTNDISDITEQVLQSLK